MRFAETSNGIPAVGEGPERGWVGLERMVFPNDCSH